MRFGLQLRADDPTQVGADARQASTIEDLSVDDALATPFLALGTYDEIAEQLHRAEERWGVGYVVVRDAQGVAPLVEWMRGA